MLWHLLIMCLFVLICMLLWQPPCTKFVIPKVLRNDGICRSTADVKLFGYISDINMSVLLTQSINSVNIVYHSLSGWTSGQSSSVIVVQPLWHLSTHWYTFLCIIQFSLYCANILLWISEGFTPCDHISQMRENCSTVVQSRSGTYMFTLGLHKHH